MSQTNSPATPFLNYERRRALLWFKRHQPAVFKVIKTDPEQPAHRLLIDLLLSDYITLTPNRKRYDPLTYSVTAKGEAALQS